MMTELHVQGGQLYSSDDCDRVSTSFKMRAHFISSRIDELIAEWKERHHRNDKSAVLFYHEEIRNDINKVNVLYVTRSTFVDSRQAVPYGKALQACETLGKLADTNFQTVIGKRVAKHLQVDARALRCHVRMLRQLIVCDIVTEQVEVLRTNNRLLTFAVNSMLCMHDVASELDGSVDRFAKEILTRSKAVITRFADNTMRHHMSEDEYDKFTQILHDHGIEFESDE